MTGGTSNPYAPPSAAPSVAPIERASLPEGFRRFRLDPSAYRAFLTAMVRRRGLPAVVFMGLVVAGTNLAMGTSIPAALLTAVLAPLFMFVFMIVSAHQSEASAILTYELIVGPRVFRRTTANAPPAEILRPEVERIVETSTGLWLSSTTPRRSLFVLRAIDGYADVREAAAAWKPIELLSGWAAWQYARRELGAQGQRDAIRGTALSSDESLAFELEGARSASSRAWVEYSTRAPVRRKWVPLALWAVLIVMFLAIWQFLSPAEPPPRSRPPVHAGAGP